MDESKNKKSIGMLIMILALVLVAVILIIVIVASSGDSATTTQDPASSSTPAISSSGTPTGTDTPGSSNGTPAVTTPAVPTTPGKPADPVGPTTDKAGENGKITVDVSDTKKGLILNVSADYKYDDTVNTLFKKEGDLGNAAFTKISSKFKTIDNLQYLRTEALDALAAMIQSFDAAAGTNKPFRVEGYTVGKAAVLDSAYITGNVFKIRALNASGNTLGLNYVGNKVSLNGSMVTYDKWFEANAATYGFVYMGLVGGENTRAGEFRYVGTIHAEGIKQAGSLTNYVASVKGGTITTLTVGGETWNLKYAAVTGPTEIEVGKDATYTVSGDNMGGVIVAYK